MLKKEKKLTKKILIEMLSELKNKLFLKKVSLLPSTIIVPMKCRNKYRLWLLKIGKSEEEASIRIQSAWRGKKEKKMYNERVTNRMYNERVMNNIIEKLIDDIWL